MNENRWRLTAALLGVLLVGQGMAGCGLGQQEQQEQAEYYRARWSQVCHLLATCPECRDRCGVAGWCAESASRPVP